MTIKTLLIAGALTVSAIGVASAKSYSVNLPSSAKVGTVDLKGGDYSVKVSGTQAVFTNEAGKSFAVPVTIGQSDKKFDSTAVDAMEKDNVNLIKEIDLGGSNTKLQFGQ